MAQLNQLVGIIELDADPELDATSDENISQTLRRLRSVAPDGVRNGRRKLTWRSVVLRFRPWNSIDDTMSDSVVVLKADLRQLHCELESELARSARPTVGRRCT